MRSSIRNSLLACISLCMLVGFLTPRSIRAQSCTTVSIGASELWVAADNGFAGGSMLDYQIRQVTGIEEDLELHFFNGTSWVPSAIVTYSYATVASSQPLRIANVGGAGSFEYCAPAEPTATPTEEPTATPTLTPTDVPVITNTPVPPTATPVVTVEQQYELQQAQFYLSTFAVTLMGGLLVLVIIRLRQ